MKGDKNDTDYLVSFLKAKCYEFNVCAEEAVLLELLIASNGQIGAALRCLGIEESYPELVKPSKNAPSKQGIISTMFNRQDSVQELTFNRKLVHASDVKKSSPENSLEFIGPALKVECVNVNSETVDSKKSGVHIYRESVMKPEFVEEIPDEVELIKENLCNNIEPVPIVEYVKETSDERFLLEKYEAYFASKTNNEVKRQVNIKRFFERDQQKENSNPLKKKSRFEKGKTFHIYTPEEIPDFLPCTFHLNFFDSDLAENLLTSVLEESREWRRSKFVLFDRAVESPHFSRFYADNDSILDRYDYVYNGRTLNKPVPYNKYMKQARTFVEHQVNRELDERQRLPHQSKLRWLAEASICNKYLDGSESVGYHSDQLTYIGPQPIIASVSLGAEREFRLKNATDSGKDLPLFSIHLPHNSMIIMHGKCQDEWKHSLVPASAASSLTPHPISGQIRINITYRQFLDKFAPSRVPKCKCVKTMILRPVFRGDKQGQYFWTCNNVYVDGKGCGQFKWADFSQSNLCER